MRARLKPIIFRRQSELQQQRKQLGELQKLIDDQTAKEFERYTARFKRKVRAAS